MLLELRVENLGIIDDVLVTFAPGSTAITGETGAGKTLLVEALDLLVGGRADPTMVRDGATEARVEGRFVHDDEEVVVTRVVPVDGRSRGYVDGRLATAAELARRGLDLVDLHGQHAHQSLLAPSEQRALLDHFAGEVALDALGRIREARAELRRLDDALAALGGDDHARAREVDLLRYQLDEIARARLDDPGEEARLAAEEALLADATAHREALSGAHALLEGGAEDALGSAVALLAGREAFQAIADRLLALQAEVSDVAHDVRLQQEAIANDPARLVEVGERRALLRDLCRKYGDTIADVLAYADEAAARLADFEGRDARAAALAEERGQVEVRLDRSVTALRRARTGASATLGPAVTEHLRELAMPTAVFDVRVTPGDLSDDGADDVEFLLAPNPGEATRPLAKAASGGELSRAMLALRVVLSEAPPTLVFDEVDAGVGGEAGVAVGRSLASLARKHQVLCVTHLAQVAAFADSQIAVTKHEVAGRTVARAEVLLDDSRVGELSRMLAGIGESAHAKRHARELLANAAEARDAVRAR